MDFRLAMTIGLLASLVTAATTRGEEKTLVRKHWFVSGQVQGVSFRAFTYEAATDLKLKGWVRNLTDGRVEIVAEGSEKAIDQLLEKVKKGPPASRVDGVKEGKVDEKEKLADHFEIRDSATPPP
ncbi:MAG: acylphosphatase [Phycisphaerales bacterium]|nr:acylphosphatase [Phycisphaerales bacterium]